MFSTFLEVLGFAAFVAATYLLAGVAPALYVAGAALLLIGYATDDATIAVSTRRAVAPAAARLAATRQRRAARRAAAGAPSKA